MIAGAQPLPVIRQTALRLMDERRVTGVLVRFNDERPAVLAFRQDVAESDDLARQVLRELEAQP